MILSTPTWQCTNLMQCWNMAFLWTYFYNWWQLNWNSQSLLTKLESILQTFTEITHDEVLTQLHYLEPMSFLALDNAGDTLTCSQMMHAPDKKDFINAKSDKINGLLKRNAWTYQHIFMLPDGAQLIYSVWSYHHKWTIDGHLHK